MATDEWLILLMGIVLGCGPFALIWMEDRTRARGIAVPALFNVKGYTLSPHSAFSLVIAVMFIFLSYQMRATGMGFVFMIFGFIDAIVAVQNIRKSGKRPS